AEPASFTPACRRRRDANPARTTGWSSTMRTRTAGLDVGVFISCFFRLQVNEPSSRDRTHKGWRYRREHVDDRSFAGLAIDSELCRYVVRTLMHASYAKPRRVTRDNEPDAV